MARMPKRSDWSAPGSEWYRPPSPQRTTAAAEAEAMLALALG